MASSDDSTIAARRLRASSNARRSVVSVSAARRCQRSSPRLVEERVLSSYERPAARPVFPDAYSFSYVSAAPLRRRSSRSVLRAHRPFVTDELERVRADHLLARAAEQVGHLLVHERRLERRVAEPDPLRCGLDDAAVALLACTQTLLGAAALSHVLDRSDEGRPACGVALDDGALMNPAQTSIWSLHSILDVVRRPAREGVVERRPPDCRLCRRGARARRTSPTSPASPPAPRRCGSTRATTESRPPR